MWMAIWVFAFIGLFIIGLAVCDCLDRKRRSVPIQWGFVLLAVLAGLLAAFPIVSGLVLWLLGLPL